MEHQIIASRSGLYLLEIRQLVRWLRLDTRWRRYALRTPRWALRVAVTMAAVAAAPLADAASYYFSSLGSDATGNGSLESPWNSINRFNQLTLTPGDSALFHAGDTFSGIMWLDSTDGGINAAGNFVAPVTIGSYGAQGRQPRENRVAVQQRRFRRV